MNPERGPAAREHDDDDPNRGERAARRRR